VLGGGLSSPGLAMSLAGYALGERHLKQTLVGNVALVGQSLEQRTVPETRRRSSSGPGAMPISAVGSLDTSQIGRAILPASGLCAMRIPELSFKAAVCSGGGAEHATAIVRRRCWTARPPKIRPAAIRCITAASDATDGVPAHREPHSKQRAARQNSRL
jgi:hypothetical protein